MRALGGATARACVLFAAVAAAGCSRILGDPAGGLPELGDVEAVAASAVKLPLKQGSLRFAVIGDTGTATRAQTEVGRQMAAWHERVGFEFVLLTGDNIYGADTAAEMKRKFEDPYAALLAKNVKFYASLGNHDNPNQRFYKLYNMNGERYYTFRPKMGVRVFAVDSNYIDRKQLAWLEKELQASGSEWKIVYFHHPLYSSGRNHDNPNQRFYKLYNMNGERYYTFRPKMGVRVFAVDSNYIDQKQLAWLEKELQASGSEWKIVYFHHPLYSSGRNHGPALATREVLEPVFVRHGVSVVLTGHEHFYERIKPQKGILHFISGGGGKLRPGDIRKDPQTAKGFDSDLHFLMIEIDGDDLFFQAVSRTGKTVDSGSFRRVGAAVKQAG